MTTRKIRKKRHNLKPEEIDKLKIGLPIIAGLSIIDAVNDEIDGRIDLFLDDGSIISLYRDGTLEEDSSR